MKNNEKLNNKTNKDFEEGFEMSNEEMNQIVGGSTFITPTEFTASCTTIASSASSFEWMTAEGICQNGCFVCLNIAFQSGGCTTKKK